MNLKTLTLASGFLISFITSFSQKNDLDTLDAYIQKQLDFYQGPGVSVGVVQDGKTLYAKGFGVREIGKEEAVDEHTLFAIGSISKSFTALSIAILVDEGKLNWDDKVIDYLPYFQLYDPYVTNSFTIRDLLTHRSGLKDVSGGTLWYHSDLNREEVIGGLKFLERESNFRYEPAYQNTMYLVASKVVEAVIGGSWDDFVRKRIFEPVEMKHTVISQAERLQSRNIAQPHIKDENRKIVVIEQEKMDNLAPAGSIYSCAIDMTNYMKLVLNEGIYNQDTIVSPKVFHELVKPQFHYKLFAGIHNDFTSYGMGWWLTPYKEYVLIEHSGGVDGMGANLIMERNKKFGIIVMTNASYSPLSFALPFAAIGSFLNEQLYKSINPSIRKNYPKGDSIRLARKAALEKSRIKDTKPSLPVVAYAAKYNDRMYGDITITEKNGKLAISFSHTKLFTGTLTHWHYNTFKIDWVDPRVPDGFATFQFDSKENVTGFKIDQPNLLDVDFTELKITKTK
jgi:CubicO group peptidase (beta-lactamase class C family)